MEPITVSDDSDEGNSNIIVYVNIPMNATCSEERSNTKLNLEQNRQNNVGDLVAASKRPTKEGTVDVDLTFGDVEHLTSNDPDNPVFGQQLIQQNVEENEDEEVRNMSILGSGRRRHSSADSGEEVVGEECGDPMREMMNGDGARDQFGRLQNAMFQNMVDPEVGISQIRTVENDDEDDVIFMGTYLQTDLETAVPAGTPLDLSGATAGKTKAKRCRKKVNVALRKNPPRNAQMLKASRDLAWKLYEEDLSDWEKKVKKGKHLVTKLNVPEVGTESGDEKAPLAKRTVCKGTAAKGRKTTRRGKNLMVKGRKAAHDNDFADRAKSTMEHVANYVSILKECNRLMESSRGNNIAERAGNIPGDGSPKAKNLRNAESILLDSCLLYSMASNVSQENIAKFLDDKAPEHCS